PRPPDSPRFPYPTLFRSPGGETLFTEASTALGFSFESSQPWFDETAREPLLPQRQNRRGPALSAADLDGDGRPELILGGSPESRSEEHTSELQSRENLVC